MKQFKRFVILFLIGLSCGCSQTSNKTYCGTVIEKYLLHKNNGGTHNIVFYCDELKRNINVSTNVDTYVNKKVGDSVCFELSDYQLGK